MAHAGAMHFDAEVVAFGMRGGKRRQVFAIAEADLEVRGASRPNNAGRSSGAGEYSTP